MTASELIELLEKNWEHLSSGLGSQWKDFYKKFQTIVDSLPQGATREDLEKVTDDLFDLMNQYQYTSGLLQGWQSVFTERLLENPLSNEEKVQQICNRLRKLTQNSKKITDSKKSSKNQNNTLNNAHFDNKEKKK